MGFLGGLAGPVIGGAIGGLGSLFGGGDQTTTTQLDPQTQQFMQFLRQQAQQGAANLRGGQNFAPGVNSRIQQGLGAFNQIGPMGQNPLFQEFLGGSRGLMGGLNFASSPFEGGQLDQFFNPFEERVVGGVQGDFDRQRELSRLAAAQQATRGGAFGGSRGAVLEAIGQNDIGRNEASVLANVRSGGFNQAMQNLQMEKQRLGGLGLQGLGNLFGGLQFGSQFDVNRAQGLLGQGAFLRNIEAQRRQDPLIRNQAIMQLLQGGIGPFGQTQTRSTFQNPMQGILGGALIGGSLFPGGGGGGGLGFDAQTFAPGPFSFPPFNPGGFGGQFGGMGSGGMASNPFQFGPPRLL